MARGIVNLSCAGSNRADATGWPLVVAKALALRTRATSITADIRAYVESYAPPPVLKTMSFQEATTIGEGGQAHERTSRTHEFRVENRTRPRPLLQRQSNPMAYGSSRTSMAQAISLTLAWASP